MTKFRIKIDQHLKMCVHDICTILKSGRRDIDVIAIVLTEAFFRSSKIRFYEFISFKILKLFRCTRASSISLGMAQLQARYWRVPVTIFRILSPITAYDLTIKHWEENKWLNLPFCKKIAIHVGEVRFYYLDIAMRCRDEAKKWAIYLPNPYPVGPKRETTEKLIEPSIIIS